MRYKGKLLPLALMLTAGCATTGTKSTQIPIQTSTGAPTDTGATDPLCSHVRIVELSKRDTTGTKEQVEANNAVIADVCGVPEHLSAAAS